MSLCLLEGAAVLAFNILGTLAAEHQVIVGGTNLLRYTPEYITADPGDTVVFSFRQENHTVTQSTFDSPCKISENGFDSGFQPVASDDTDGPFPAAVYTVVDTNPVWVFCRQVGHCQQGMVFAINPGTRFAAFQAAAMGNATTSSVAAMATSTTADASAVLDTTSTVSLQTTAPVATPNSIVVTVTSIQTTTVIASSTSLAPSSSPVSSTSAASPPTSTSTDHTIIVGGIDKLTYSPSNISADIGDTITFKFMQSNHTATQSSFANPCVELAETSTTGEVGFDSGFMPVADNATTYPTFTIQVNDTSPVWVYCKQTSPKSHCGAGMVFSVNAVETGPNNFSAFQSKAIEINGTATNATKSSGAGTAAPCVWPCAVAAVVVLLAGLFI
ncbi:hypothetical protein WOLCODRAFT_97131 [Wolfiporia cocos MD-104 SS10]|uniref:Cupredoxin n=1 Tax=Wolfiporia cocos (strain MD-104) TaxID=742152 RepID=A0A2H3JI62_WOLCO|nr:hypothetical protein WOLCODRAFT_97131 [Wolfiporia cocos MD-104 SS10]